MFVRSDGRHRKPSEILKTFIKTADEEQVGLSKDERTKLNTAFKFLQSAYKNSGLGVTRLATDQTHFYILATSLLGSDLLTRFTPAVLAQKLVRLGDLIDGRAEMPEGERLSAAFKRYQDLSREKTTDASRRKDRQAEFIRVIDLLP